MTNSIRTEKGKSLLMFPDSFCVLDLETTGFSPDFDDIIDIGIIKIINNQIVDTFSSLIYCDYVPEHISEITGITQEMLVDAPCLEDVLPKAVDFIGDNLIVGHNISFDINFLYDEKIRLMNSPLKNDFVCTMRTFRYLHKDLLHHRLCDMVDFYNEVNENAHRALSDCYATLGCFNKMKKEAFDLYQSNVLPNARTSHKRSAIKVERVFDIIEDVENCIDNPFVNKYCVFTGALSAMTRSEAQQFISDLGGIPENTVTKKTNFLILGDYDYINSVKDGKSNKHKKAEQLLINGQDITIITESVFLELVNPLLKQENKDA